MRELNIEQNMEGPVLVTLELWINPGVVLSMVLLEFCRRIQKIGNEIVGILEPPKKAQKRHVELFRAFSPK